MTRTIRTKDERTLDVHEAGDPAGFPVLFHHGTPAAGLPYEPHVALAREQGIRLIGYDRPGYGGSTRAKDRRVEDCVADVTEIADALHLDRFATWGISGGGPHALACAALCDDRLKAVASLAAVAPFGADGLDWLEGMGEDNLVEFGKALDGEEALRGFCEPLAEEMIAADPEALVDVIASLLGPADQAVLTGAFAEYLHACDAHGLESGVDGWIDDDFAFVEPWGFEVGEITRPVLLLHGEDDRFVPVSHGHWLAARIPDVDARIDPADGHLTLLERRMREVNAWLLSHS
ncbi:MAG TPA: alpha/beta fold hydrolase [Gaiellaceae bacterium]|nr:alpha/beta fold hydrolase [Gaiellaceae bacterium]